MPNHINQQLAKYHLNYQPFQFAQDEYTAGLDIYLVGGAIRDRLLNCVVTEKDWVIVGDEPEDLLKRGFKPIGKDFPVFLHPKTGEEYALARTERKSGHGHKGFIYQSDASITLEQDLLRRDLTINAIAQNQAGELIDPCQGIEAIANRRLRHIDQSFSDDPLRLFRVARFHARYRYLGFYVSRATIAAMREISRANELNYLPAERIWQETQKALGERHPEEYFLTLQRSDALAHWFTELDNGQFQTLMEALSQVKRYLPQRVLRWATLLSDLNTQSAHWLQERLRVPKIYQQTAHRLQLGIEAAEAGLNAHRLLQWANDANFWRQPEALSATLMVLQILMPKLDVPLLRNALRCAQQLNVSQIVNTSKTDAEIGQRIQAAKLVSIEKSLREY